MQGNRITGRETIPIIIGGERTQLLLKYFLGGIFLLLLLASLGQLVSPFGFALLFLPLTNLILFSAYERGSLHSGLILEFLVDSQLIFAGILSLLWRAF